MMTLLMIEDDNSRVEENTNMLDMVTLMKMMPKCCRCPLSSKKKLLL